MTGMQSISILKKTWFPGVWPCTVQQRLMNICRESYMVGVNSECMAALACRNMAIKKLQISMQDWSTLKVQSERPAWRVNMKKAKLTGMAMHLRRQIPAKKLPLMTTCIGSHCKPDNFNNTWVRIIQQGVCALAGESQLSCWPHSSHLSPPQIERKGQQKVIWNVMDKLVGQHQLVRKGVP